MGNTKQTEPTQQASDTPADTKRPDDWRQEVKGTRSLTEWLSKAESFCKDRDIQPLP